MSKKPGGKRTGGPFSRSLAPERLNQEVASPVLHPGRQGVLQTLYKLVGEAASSGKGAVQADGSIQRK